MKTGKAIFKALVFLSLVLTLAVPAFAASGIQISDYAGSGETGYRDGPRLQANFSQPYGMAFDKDGNLIIADSYNNRIRMVKGDDVITVAGFSNKKDSFGLPLGGMLDGDALKARFNKPRAVAVDSKGNIFVADSGNHSIRKISGDKVYTFAGSGKSGYRDETGVKAQFNTPCGIAIDKDDNVYVADSLNNVIRKITPKGVVTTFAGKQSDAGGYKDGPAAEALFNEPSGIEVDKGGEFYVLDGGNQLLRKIGKDNKVTTVAGSQGALIEGTSYYSGGFKDGSSAMFNFPKGLDIADDGTIFIADTWNHRIRALTTSGEVVTIAGNGTPGRRDGNLSDAELNGPASVRYRSGKLYISDMWNNCIRTMPVSLNSLIRIPSKEEMVQGISFGTSYKDIQVFVDKKKVNFPDLKPYIDGTGRTMLPLRFICEAWGAKVDWNPKDGKVGVTRGGKTVTFKYDDKTVAIRNDRTVIKTRDLAESLDFYVLWAPEYNAVLISTGQ